MILYATLIALILSWYFYLRIYFVQIRVDGTKFAANNFVQLIQKFTSGLQFESLPTSSNLLHNSLQPNSLLLVAY